MHILDLLFPRRCLSCGKIGKYFCDRCKTTIRVIEQRETICPVCERPAISGATHPYCKTRYTIDGLTSFFHYDGIIQKAVKSLKYRSVSDLASEFVNLIPSQFFNNVTMKQFSNGIIVPIPLHPLRLRFRGFNQADVLAHCFLRRQADVVAQCIARQQPDVVAKFTSRHIVFRVDNTILKRTKYTTPQVEMTDRKKRLTNMEKVFTLNNVTIQQCNNVILFDDVFTTGATMRAAANVLKRGGAPFVWGITMAR